MKRKTIIFILALMTTVGLVKAQDENFQSQYGLYEAFFLGTSSGVGGRALSMGSAYTAVADDYSATLWNPAGLTQLRRMELFLSMLHFQYNDEATMSDLSTSDETSATKLNSIGFAFPIPTYRGSLVFAVGYNRIRNFEGGFLFKYLLAANTDSSYYQTYNEMEGGSLKNWVLSGAIEATENLSIGASLNIWRGNDDFQKIDLYDSERNLYYFDRTFTLDINTTYKATNFTLGALYKIGVLGRIAAKISTPMKLNSVEKWHENTKIFDNYDPQYADYSAYTDTSGSWEWDVETPYELGVGAAITLFPNFVLAADIKYKDWTQLRCKNVPPLGDLDSLNLYFKNGLRATSSINLGGEFTVPLINTQLRAGVIYQPTPFLVPQQVGNDVVYKKPATDEDQKFITLGAGILIDKQVKLDVAYVRGWWQQPTIKRYPNIDEKISTSQIFASMSIRF